MKISIGKILLALFVCGCSSSQQADQLATLPQKQVIYKDAAGRELTLGDLSKADGQFEWELRESSGTPIPDRAKQRHQAGRKSGAAGNYQQAIVALKEASTLAPSWAYPIYDLAYTHLLTGADDQALEAYEAVDRMEPRGFFTSKTAVWSLAREKSGDLPPGTYRKYLEIESAQNDAIKLKLAEAIVAKAPRYAPAWKEIAILSEKLEGRLPALESGLATAPDADTHGCLIVNKAALLDEQGNRNEAVKLLGELTLNPRSTFGTITLAKMTLALMQNRK